MVYLFVLFFCTIYLYFTEKYFFKKSFLKQLIIWMPAFFVYFIPIAFQYNVGSDYFTYYNYFYNNDHVYYLNRHEYIYYLVVCISNYFNIPQLQFVIISFIQTLLLFFIIYKLKKYNYITWLVFLIFFLVTGIYHNQMNGIRQYVALLILPIIAIYSFERKIIKTILWGIIASFFHFSSLLPTFIVIFFSFIYKFIPKKILFSLFLLSIFIYYIDWSSMIFDFLENHNNFYSKYEDSDFNDSKDILSLLLKFVSLPFVFAFWFYYFLSKNKSNFLNYFALIWAFSHFMFLMALNFGMANRVYLYFVFFIIFPLYFISVYSRKWMFFIIVFYFVFYFLKVTFFAKSEYLYYFNGAWL